MVSVAGWAVVSAAAVASPMRYVYGPTRRCTQLAPISQREAISMALSTHTLTTCINTSSVCISYVSRVSHHTHICTSININIVATRRCCCCTLCLNLIATTLLLLGLLPITCICIFVVVPIQWQMEKLSINVLSDLSHLCSYKHTHVHMGYVLCTTEI